jgi:hypothetical protein
VLEESDVTGLDGLLGRAEASLVDLLLVPGQLLVQLLDLLVHRLAPHGDGTWGAGRVADGGYRILKNNNIPSVNINMYATRKMY